MTVVSKKLEYADRFAVQQANQAIRRDVIRALVELITNSNDSYQRLEGRGIKIDGTIAIVLHRKRINSVLRVIDYAEGMSEQDMDNKVGEYGGETSGFKDGSSVRGFWGRGLKDAMLGLGQGDIISIKDGTLNKCSLSIKKGKPIYERDKALKATGAIRHQYDIKENGTILEIAISAEKIRVPQFDSLRRNLERHFELRAIMGNSNRKIILRDMNMRGKIKHQDILSHKEPVGERIYVDDVSIDSCPSAIKVEVFRANDPLSTPSEEGDYADAGMLIVSRGIVLGLTLFKYENNEHASRFYGHIQCDYIHELLKSDDGVLTATRDGINWKHNFAKELKNAIEKILEPLVEEERKRAAAQRQGTMNKQLRSRIRHALAELNSIANSELGKVTGPGTGGDPADKKTPFIPDDGFGFIPQFALIQTGKPALIYLRAAIPDKLKNGAIVEIQSDNPEVRLKDNLIKISALEDYPNIGEGRVELEGRQVGSESIITAKYKELKAEALVKVISKPKVKPKHDPQKPHGGLFQDVKFDHSAQPRQRVRFDRANSTIVISTKAPSIAEYLDEVGNGSETPQGQVLLAELITEAVCYEIARQGVEDGIFSSHSGSESDAIRKAHITLQNKYAHKIHECVVNSEYRRRGSGKSSRKGRPKKEETLRKSIRPV